ncbi:MAG: glycosyltransferase [Chitinophagaceae bacterium]|nr:glycosyltransferase [Chitinophagaceae bacterium]
MFPITALRIPGYCPYWKKYAGLDKRVKYHIQKKNLSIVPNFQFLLDNASGEYFMWAADDDQWNNDFIERCVKAMETNNEVAIAITRMDVFDKNIMWSIPDRSGERCSISQQLGR